MFAVRTLRPSALAIARSSLKSTAIRFHHGCGCGCGGHDDGIVLFVHIIYRCTDICRLFTVQCDDCGDCCGGGCGGGGCCGGHQPALLKVCMIPNGEYQENAYLMWDATLGHGFDMQLY